MSKKVSVTPIYLRRIGNALRYKLNEERGYYPSEMPDAIMRIESGTGSRCPRSEVTTTFDYYTYSNFEISYETKAYEEQ